MRRCERSGVLVLRPGALTIRTIGDERVGRSVTGHRKREAVFRAGGVSERRGCCQSDGRKQARDHEDRTKTHFLLLSSKAAATCPVPASAETQTHALIDRYPVRQLGLTRIRRSVPQRPRPRRAARRAGAERGSSGARTEVELEPLSAPARRA